MVLANVVQQVVNLLILISVPQMITTESFGQVTFVVTLLSFMSFSDLGLSFVYSRKMPALYGRNNHSEIATWNTTIFRFRAYGALVFGTAAGLIYLDKYGDVQNAVLLAMTAPLASAASFYIASNIAQGAFGATRNAAVLQAVARLCVIPGVAAWGVRGWFVGQLAASVLAFGQRNLRTTCTKGWKQAGAIDWSLVRANVSEAIALGLITTLWTLLLSSGRFAAAFKYPDVVVGKYGVAASAYQMMSALMIAAFIPQTVKLYRLLDVDQNAAIDYVLRVIIWTLPIAIAFACASVLAAPPLLNYVFPSYGVDFQIVAPLMLSFVNYPAIVTLGGIWVGTNRHSMYLPIIVACLCVDWVATELLEPRYGYNAAAMGQLLSLSVFAVVMLLAVAICYRRSAFRGVHIWIAILASAMPVIALMTIPMEP